MNKDYKLSKSIYLKADLILKSPIIIGNGISEETDMDLLLDSDNNPFIPGSSLAGAINYELQNKRGIDEKNLNLLFGRKDVSKKENINSMIYFYDAYLKDSYLENNSINKTICIRDGVKLKEDTKTAEDKSKYDFQVLNTGAVFEFKIEILLRKNYDYLGDFSKEIIGSILKIIENGELRLGAKSNRGYGKIGLENIKISQFDFDKKEDIDKYIDFEWNDMNSDYKEFIKLADKTKTPYTKIEVPLDIKSTLLIRTYFLSNTDVDSQQITIDKKAVIPGTSWSGMIRHRALQILKNINENKANKMIDYLFGYVNEKNKDEIFSSRIIFDESMDNEQTKLVKIMRTKIDRFTGGACNTGLFEEKVAVGGSHQLNIMIKDAKDYEIGLLILVIKDIENGFLAIGGETNIGRGIFITNKPAYINKEVIDDKKFKYYVEALSEELCL